MLVAIAALASAGDLEPDPSDYISRYSLDQIRDNAEKGDSKAQAALGYMYLFGKNVPQADNLAVSFLSKAAAQGDPYASFQLGNLYLVGRGCEQSSTKATSLIKIAADQGDQDAQMQLAGLLLEGPNPSDGVSYLTQLAEKGKQEAMLMLADEYVRSKSPIANDEWGFKWYMRAAKAGNLRGQLMSARCLRYGIGTAPNRAQALEFYRKASESGSEEATKELREFTTLRQP